MADFLSATDIVVRRKTAAPESYLAEARRAVSDAVSPDEGSSVTPKGLAMGAAFAYPLAVSHIVNSPRVRKDIIPRVRTQAELGERIMSEGGRLEGKYLRPGDVIMMGSPRPSGSSLVAALGSGETDFQHAAVFTHFDEATGKPHISHLVKGPGFFNEAMLTDNDIRSVKVLRSKDPAHTQQILDHVKSLGDTFNPSTGRKLDWSLSRGAKAVLKDHLVPEALQRRMSTPWDEMRAKVTKEVFSDPALAHLSTAEKLNKVESVCTSVVGTAVPSAFPHKNPWDVLPKDILGSDAFEHVVDRRASDHDIFQGLKGYFKNKRPDLSEEAIDALARGRFGREKLVRGIAQHGRLLTSLGLGAAGAGLVAAGFHAPDSDLSAGEAAVGLGALGAGAAPFVAPKLLDRWALNTLSSRRETEALKELGPPTLEQFKRLSKLPKTNFGKALPHHAINAADALRNLKLPGKLLAAGGVGLLGYNLLKDKEEPESRPLF